MHNFRRLAVWDRAHLFAVAVRRATRRFPRTGYADQKSQLVRAAESIPADIVEGCAAATDKEFARYLDIAIKSTAETEYRLQLALDTGVLDRRSWRILTAEVVEIRTMLSGLRRPVLGGDADQMKRPRKPRSVDGGDRDPGPRTNEDSGDPVLDD